MLRSKMSWVRPDQGQSPGGSNSMKMKKSPKTPQLALTKMNRSNEPMFENISPKNLSPKKKGQNQMKNVGNRKQNMDIQSTLNKSNQGSAIKKTPIIMKKNNNNPSASKKQNNMNQQINKSPQTFSAIKKKMEVPVMTGNESPDSQENENSEEEYTTENKREVNLLKRKLNPLSKNNKWLKNKITLNVSHSKTELSEDDAEDDDVSEDDVSEDDDDSEEEDDSEDEIDLEDENVEDEINPEDNDSDDENEADVVEQNVKNRISPKILKLNTKDRPKKAPVDHENKRLNMNKLMDTIASKSSGQVSSNLKKNNKSPEITSNSKGEGMRVFHKNKYQWVNKLTVEKVKADNPGLSEADLNEVLYKMARKNSKRGIFCWLCQGENHKIESCPLTAKDPGLNKQCCFRCGSEGHKSGTCTVPKEKGKEFSFARCFKCNKVGHLISSCPESGGIYPYGGSCLECGSIEHYRRNCPKVKKTIKEHQDEEIVLPLMKDGESVEGQARLQKKPMWRKKKFKSQTPWKSKPGFKGKPAPRRF